jgi:uncharacterized protein YecE (DUF72 family)
MVNNWNKRTPENFKFVIKFLKIITHDKRLKNVEKDIEQFLDDGNFMKINSLLQYNTF